MIPLATTTISVLRLSSSELTDPYSDSIDTGYSVIASGIRAVISAPSGSEKVAGGEQSTVVFRLSADPCDLDHEDRVMDESSGAVFRVDWSYSRSALGLDHVTAGLRRIVGLA